MSGAPWSEIESRLLELHQYKPTKADALYTLGDRHFNKGHFQLAYVFGTAAAAIPKPDLWSSENVLLRESTSLYEYKAIRLAGFAANRIGKNDECIKFLTQLVRIHIRAGPNARAKIHLFVLLVVITFPSAVAKAAGGRYCQNLAL